MSRLFQGVMLCLLALCSSLPLLAADPPAIVPEAPPIFNFSGIGMVPARAVSDLAGATMVVEKDKISISLGERSIAFTIGNKEALQDNKPIALPLAPFIAEELVYVPAKVLVTALGGTLANAPDNPKVLQIVFPGVGTADVTLVRAAATPQEFLRTTTELYLVPLDGGKIRQLTYDMVGSEALMDRRSPHFTADGKGIVFARGNDIFTRSLHQPRVTNLTAASSQQGIASGIVVPGGNGAYAFMQLKTAGDEGEKPFPDICRMLADGSDLKRLAKGVLPMTNVDGSLIVYMDLDKDQNPLVRAMKADGTDNRLLGSGLLSAVAPDGSRVTFVQLKPTENGPQLTGMVSMNLADGKVAEPAAGDATVPAVLTGPFSTFSPDSKRLVCMQQGSGLWIMDADLTRMKQLTAGNDRSPQFSPDGKFVAFVRGNLLFAVPAEGTEADVRPLSAGILISEFAFSPDGKHLLVEGIPNLPIAELPPPVTRVKREKQAPPSAEEVAAVKNAGTRQAVITTSKGVIEVELYGADAPLTTANFIKLAKVKYYDGLAFHRVVPDFVIQGGDPNGDGTGGPGYTIKLETSPKLKHGVGTLAMARRPDPDSAGSQFYITLTDTEAVRNLDNPQSPYAVFGKVLKGMEVVKQIVAGDKIISITIK